MKWGSVDEASVVEGAVADRFDRFMDALVNGQVVPLLGAGVSRDSAPLGSGLIDMLKPLIKEPFSTADCRDLAQLAEAYLWQNDGATAL